MSELNFQEDKSLYTIDPEILIFKLDTDNLLELNSNKSKISKQIELKIKNEVNEYLSFKIKTTKKLNYIITPSYFIIAPKEEKIIKIRFKRDEGEELKLKPYKILLEGFIIKENEKDIESKKLFEKYKKSGEKVVAKIIQVRSQFLDKNDNHLSLSSSNSSELKNNEKSIFVSALSQDSIDNINTNNHQIKDENNPLLINQIKSIIETKDDNEDIKDKEITEKINKNTIDVKIKNNEIRNNVKLDHFENENKIEDKSKINLNNTETSLSKDNIDTKKENEQNVYLNNIKNEKIDLLSIISKKQLIIAIIVISIIILLIIYFTI